MKEKSTLPPLFVLSFLIVMVIVCLIFIYSFGLVGSAFGYYQLINMRVQPVQPISSAQPHPSSTLITTALPLPSSVMLTAINIVQKTEIYRATGTKELSPTDFQTPTPNPTTIPSQDTPTPTATLSPTTTRDPVRVQETQSAEMTLQVANMMDTIDDLYAKGKINSKIGEYYRLPNFADESSDPNSFRRVQSGYAPANFVLRSDLTWQVDNNQGNWVESGCGVIFRENEVGEYYLIYLSADGRARLKRFIGSSLALLGRSTIFSVNRDLAEAELLLVVEGETVSIIINRELKYEAYSDTIDGKLSFVVVTGNPNGFGTRCWMNNTDLWIMGK